MKLNENTINTLQKVNRINQSLKVVEGELELRSTSSDGTTLAIGKIDQEFPRDFHVYDLVEFLKVIGLFEDPEIDFSNDKYVLIESGSQKLRYLETDQSLIKSYTDKTPKLKKIDLSFSVTKEQVKSVMDAAKTLNLEYVGFTSQDGKILFRAFNKIEGDGNEENEYSVEIGETDKSFNLFFKTEKLEIVDNDAEFSFMDLLSKIECDNMTYFMTCDMKATKVE